MFNTNVKDDHTYSPAYARATLAAVVPWNYFTIKTFSKQSYDVIIVNMEC